MTDSRQYVLWAFKMTGCTDCGWRPQSIEELRRMECDHRDPATKRHIDTGTGGLNRGGTGLTSFRRYSLGSILEELWKCDPVCKDCHNKRGRARRRPGQIPLPLLEWLAEPIEPITEWDQDSLNGAPK